MYSAYIVSQQVYSEQSLYRSTLIQDIQHGNRGCANTNDGMKKSHPPLLLHLIKINKELAFQSTNDERMKIETVRRT